MKNPIAGAACVIAIVILAAFGLSACDPVGKATEPFKDAERADTHNNPADVVTMPDGFSNISTKCVDGIRYSVLYHADNPYGSLSTVVDPNC